MEQAAERRAGVSDVSLLRLLVPVLRGRRLIVRAAVSFSAFVFLVSFVLPPKYSSEAMFEPQSGGGNLGQLAALAAQLSFPLPGTTGGESPDFYLALLRSPAILGKVVDTQYEVRSRSRWLWWRDTVVQQGTLVDLFKIDEESAAKARQTAAETLSDQVSMSSGRTTGIVTVRITTEWPDLSRAILQRMLQLVNEFNVGSRQSQAAAERVFTEGRLVEAKRELREVEDELQAFLSRNRDFRNSPSLLFENERLRREVDLRHQVVLAVSQAYEQARIAEVRNTPVIVVVQPPELPAFPDSRFLILKTLASLFFGALMAAAAIAVGDAFQAPPGGAVEEVEEVRRLGKEAWRDVARFWPWRRKASVRGEA